MTPQLDFAGTPPERERVINIPTLLIVKSERIDYYVNGCYRGSRGKILKETPL
jgi:hypothetical protein